MFLSIILIFCPFDGSPRRHVPELAIVIPKEVTAMKSGWRRMPWRATKTFHHGYFAWCDDPDCWLCAEYVYQFDPEFDNRPDVKIEKK